MLDVIPSPDHFFSGMHLTPNHQQEPEVMVLGHQLSFGHGRLKLFQTESAVGVWQQYLLKMVMV